MHYYLYVFLSCFLVFFVFYMYLFNDVEPCSLWFGLPEARKLAPSTGGSIWQAGPPTNVINGYTCTYGGPINGRESMGNWGFKPYLLMGVIHNPIYNMVGAHLVRVIFVCLFFFPCKIGNSFSNLCYAFIRDIAFLGWK